MQHLIKSIISQLYIEAQYDQHKLSKFSPTFLFTPMEPIDFEDLYLSITKEQGEDLVTLIREHNIQNLLHDGIGLNPRFPWDVTAKDKVFTEVGGSLITTARYEN